MGRDVGCGCIQLRIFRNLRPGRPVHDGFPWLYSRAIWNPLDRGFLTWMRGAVLRAPLDPELDWDLQRPRDA